MDSNAPLVKVKTLFSPVDTPFNLSRVRDSHNVGEHILAQRVDRALESRRARYTDEVANILEAAYRVIEASDSTDPSLRAILAEAGVSTPVFYRHFASKDDLLVALLDDGRRRLADYLKARIDEAGDPEGQVRAWIDGMLAQVVAEAAAHRTRPFLVDQGRLDKKYSAEQKESIKRLLDLLDPAVRAMSGTGRDARGRARRNSVAIYRLVTATMREHLTDQTVPTRAERTHLADFCLAGIRGTR
jgi:AcrR family transcriptional regulator